VSGVAVSPGQFVSVTDIAAGNSASGAVLLLVAAQIQFLIFFASMKARKSAMP